MLTQRSAYGFGKMIELDFAAAVQRVKDALAAEGFGILCEIDVAATMKRKLDVEFRPYVILGACNPPLAYRALVAEPDIGLLLPCNVVVYGGDVPGQTAVAALDPVAALGLADNADLPPLAETVKDRLSRALDSIA